MHKNNTLEQILIRLEKLEKKVNNLEHSFSTKNINEEKSIKKRHEFAGATGGLRFLISQHFFDKKRSFVEIKEALNKNGYYYSNQAIQTPLNNLSSKAGCPLVAYKEEGKKVYAKRK